MPDRPVFYFCRICGHRGQFVVGPDEEVKCPECRKRYVDTIMVRRDVEWAKVETSQ